MIDYSTQETFFKAVQEKAAESTPNTAWSFTAIAALTIINPFNFIFSPFSLLMDGLIAIAKYVCLLKLIQELGPFTTFSLLIVTNSSFHFIISPLSAILTGLLVATIILCLVEAFHFAYLTNNLMNSSKDYERSDLFNTNDYISLENLNFCYLATIYGLSTVLERLQDVVTSLYSNDKFSKIATFVQTKYNLFAGNQNLNSSNANHIEDKSQLNKVKQ